MTLDYGEQLNSEHSHISVRVRVSKLYGMLKCYHDLVSLLQCVTMNIDHVSQPFMSKCRMLNCRFSFYHMLKCHETVINKYSIINLKIQFWCGRRARALLVAISTSPDMVCNLQVEYNNWKCQKNTLTCVLKLDNSSSLRHLAFCRVFM